MRTFIIFALLSILSFSALGHLTIQERLALIQRSTKPGDQVDQVLGLLQDLSDSTSKALADLQTRWDSERAELEAQVAANLELANDKDVKCKAIQAEIDAIQAEIDKTKKQIDDANNVIDNNNKNIEQMKDQRCQENLLFITRQKENNQALKLLAFMRAALKSDDFKNYLVSQEQGAFIQLQAGVEAHKMDNNFLFLQKLVKSNDPFQILSALHVFLEHGVSNKQDVQVGYQGDANIDDVLDVKGRDDAEIGTGHVDNDKDALTLEDFNSKNWTVDDLIFYALQAIDKLEQLIKKSGQDLIEKEIASVTALIDYIGTAEDEIDKIKGQIADLEDHVKNLEQGLKQNQDAGDVCQKELAGLRQAHQDSIDNLQEKTDAYTIKVEHFNEDIALFAEAIRLYKLHVDSAQEKYRARIDDYADDKDIDNQDFEVRDTNTDISDFENATAPKVKEPVRQPAQLVRQNIRTTAVLPQ